MSNWRDGAQPASSRPSLAAEAGATWRTALEHDVHAALHFFTASFSRFRAEGMCIPGSRRGMSSWLNSGHARCMAGVAAGCDSTKSGQARFRVVSQVNKPGLGGVWLDGCTPRPPAVVCQNRVCQLLESLA